MGTATPEDTAGMGTSILAKGILGTSINDIAKATKVNKAIVYYYFKNKASLLYEIMSGILRGLIDLNIQISNSSIPPRAKLETLIENHIKWQASNYGFSGIGYMERKNVATQAFTRLHRLERRI